MGAPSPSPAAPLQLLRWRARTQVFVERTGGLELPMVRIPAGSFAMGSPEGEEGRREREGSTPHSSSTAVIAEISTSPRRQEANRWAKCRG